MMNEFNIYKIILKRYFLIRPIYNYDIFKY